MKPINLDSLQSPQARVLARFATRDNAAGDAPEWSDPREVTLRVTRYPPTKKRGALLCLSVIEFPWAEYTNSDWQPKFNEFLAEEYRMQIIKVIA
jgi:hypothetical protein